MVDGQTGQLVREEQGTGLVTNQRAELEAIRVAVEMISVLADYVAWKTVIHLYTDSEYSIQALTNWGHTWKVNQWRTRDRKPVKNRDLIEPLLDLLLAHRVVFFHSPSHTEKQDPRSLGNARADTLAQQATVGLVVAKPRRKRKRVKATE